MKLRKRNNWGLVRSPIRLLVLHLVYPFVRQLIYMLYA